MMASPARVATAVQEALNHGAAKGIARELRTVRLSLIALKSPILTPALPRLDLPPDWDMSIT